MVRSVTQEFKADKLSGTKEESYVTQRQRLRKTGPFAVDSQSIPDCRIKYAGAWAPPASHKDESDAEDDGGPGPNPGPFEHKQVLYFFFTCFSYTFFFYLTKYCIYKEFQSCR